MVKECLSEKSANGDRKAVNDASSLVIFEDSREALRWLRAYADESAMVTTLPFIVDQSIHCPLLEFLRLAPGFNPDAKIILRKLQNGDYALLPFQIRAINILRPQPIEANTVVYRFDTIFGFQGIWQHGFYQIPGRGCFVSSLFSGGHASRESLPIAFLLPNKWLLKEKWSDEFALDFTEDILGTSLPESIKDRLAEEERGLEGHQRVSHEILLLGESTDMLAHIPIEYIDKTETLRAIETHRGLDPFLRSIAMD